MLIYIEKLQQLQSLKHMSINPIGFEIAQVAINFVGRQSEIQTLEGFFSNPTKFLIRIIGMGGVGKSELAKKFANIHLKDSNCIWLNGENKESLKLSVFRLADLTKVETSERNHHKNTVDILIEILTKIKNKNQLRTMLIIDNVDEANEDVKLILTKVDKGQCFAIVTSRNVGVVDYAGEVVDLDVLGNRDAQQFVKGSIDNEPEVEVQKLCSLLHNFPLALQQAIAYIKKQKSKTLKGQSYKIRDYLDDYKTQKDKLLDFPLNQIEHEHRETTLVTWNVSIDKIEGDEKTGGFAIELLNMMAYFDPDKIHVDLIKKIYREFRLNSPDDDQEIHEEAIELIKSYSLVKVEDSMISIHRLVQEVIRSKNTSCNTKIQFLQKLLYSIRYVKDELKQCDMTHILSVWRHSSKFNQLVQEFNYLPYIITTSLRNLSLYREMLEFATVNYEKLKTVLGHKHPETLRMESQVASALGWDGKYEDALEKYKTAYETQRSILGDDHEATLTTGHHMAMVLDNLGKLEEAMSLYTNVLDQEVKVLGKDHQWTMTTKHQMASILTQQKKYVEAMKLYNEILVWQKSQLGEENSFTMTTRHNIAWCLYSHGKFEEAKKLFQEVLQLEVKVRGEEHSSTLATKYMLACSLDELGQNDEAMDIFQHVLVLREKVLGQQHPRTINTRYTIDLFTRRNSNNSLIDRNKNRF